MISFVICVCLMIEIVFDTGVDRQTVDICMTSTMPIITLDIVYIYSTKYI